MRRFASPKPTGPMSHGVHVVQVSVTLSMRPTEVKAQDGMVTWRNEVVAVGQASYHHLSAAGRPLNAAAPATYMVHGEQARMWAAALGNDYATGLAFIEAEIETALEATT